MFVDNPLIQIAHNIAVLSHADQKYGDKPYMYHILGVVKNITEGINRISSAIDISDEERTRSICLAYLHDVIEDCPDFNHNTLIDTFGKDLFDQLCLLSHGDESYSQYLYNLSTDQECCMVKAADLLFNIEHSKKEKSGYAKQRLAKYQLALMYLQERCICVYRMTHHLVP